jgi:hypothetical protein
LEASVARVTRQLSIRGAPTAVFALLDPSLIPRRFPGQRFVKTSAGPLGVGATYDLDVLWGDDSFTVVAFEPVELLAYQTDDGLFRETYRVAATAGGSRLELEMLHVSPQIAWLTSVESGFRAWQRLRAIKSRVERPPT